MLFRSGAFVLCLIGRALNILPLSLIVNQFRTKKISMKVQFVLWFSGLRGIIAFALALNVPGGDHDVIAAATLIIVMLTIIIFGGGTVPVLQCMGMIKESKSEREARRKDEAQDAADVESKGSCAQSKLLDPERSEQHKDYSAQSLPKLKKQASGKNWFERLDEKIFLRWFRHPDATFTPSVEEDSDEDDD